MRTILLVLLVSVAHTVLSARILVLIPFPGKSHHIFATAIIKSLAARGHHVVEYSPYPPSTPIPNHIHVEVHTNTELEMNNRSYDDYALLPAKYNQNIIGYKIKWIWKLNQKLCENFLSDVKVKQLIESDTRFDLVMTESTFGQESLIAFGHRFSAPTVTLETLFPWVILNWSSGNTLSVASVPDLFSKLMYNEQLSFGDRVLNVVSVFLTLWNYHHSHLPFHDQLVQKYFPHSPSVSAMVNNVSLTLVNSHPTVVNYIQPYTPNIVPVGGLHISPDRTPLPKDIKSFLDGATEGFIFFSLGTVIQTNTFPEKILKIFTNVFKRLPLRVLWKNDLKQPNDIPKNVMITKWAPQIEVLEYPNCQLFINLGGLFSHQTTINVGVPTTGMQFFVYQTYNIDPVTEHPNCQLFITHGGLFSHHEAMYAGVPTVGMPFFADQPYNLQYNVVRGKGVVVDWTTLDEDSLFTAIITVLNNSRYIDSAVRLSKIYRDQPMSPLDRAVFWVEYVLRHEGAHHLKPASLNLSWYQLLLLDVFGVILVAFLIVLVTVYTIVKLLLSFFFGGFRQQQVSSGKKTD